MPALQLIKTHVHAGDLVKVISGNHRGSEGKILQVNRAKHQVVIEGVRMIKKHVRRSQEQPNGAILEREGPIHISNVRLLEKLSRALINNMVSGVSQGFRRDLEIQGVGFRAAVKGDKLDLSIGYSHPILFSIPKEIKVVVTDNTKISIEGIDKQLVGQVAADIRAYYPPEPYKGKGIRYSDEMVRRKEGKTVQ